MKRTFVSASVHPAKFDYKDWPQKDGWTAEVVVVNEHTATDGSRIFNDETMHYHHYDFSKCWEFVAQVKLDCVETVRNLGGIPPCRTT